MFLKTEDCNIIGISHTSKLYWKEYEVEKKEEKFKHVKILCDDLVVKGFYNFNQEVNIENAKAWLTDVFNALKRNEHFYEVKIKEKRG